MAKKPRPDTFEQRMKELLEEQVNKAYQRGYLDAINGKPMKKKPS